MVRASREHSPSHFPGERGKEARIELPKLRAELVVGLTSVPDSVLLGPGEYGDGLCQLGIRGQRTVCGHVDARDVGQGRGIDRVGLPPRDGTPVSVADNGPSPDEDRTSITACLPARKATHHLAHRWPSGHHARQRLGTFVICSVTAVRQPPRLVSWSGIRWQKRE